MTKQEYLTKHTGNGDTARKDLDELLERYCREQKRIDSIAVDNQCGFDGDVVNLQAALNAIANAPSPEL